jgi:hypothetical protein
MSFTPPVVFVDGTGLAAVSLESNNVALREYINVDIVETDLALTAFSTSDLQEGEAVAVTNDFVFMSGDSYSGYFATVASIPSDRLYHTSTVKRYKPMETVRWQSIPTLGKSFYMEDFGDALIEIGFFAFEAINDSCRGAVYPWNVSPPAGDSRADGQDSQFILAVDGIPTATSKSIAYAFSEGGTGVTNFGTFSIMQGNSGYGNGAAAMRKYVTIMYLAKDLPQGWHTSSVLVNACNEEGFVSMRNLNIECFYRMGFNPTSQSTIATNRKLPQTIF